MNIYEKLSAITSEISAVAKNLLIEAGANKYKAVSEGDVLAAVKPAEAKHGVYSYPYSRRVIESGTITTVRKGYEQKQQFLRLETVYRFVNIEKPEEYIDVTTYGDGVDPMDKATGKAMTYSDKYALLKAYKIITGDDPDQYASEPLKEAQTEKARALAAYPSRDEMIACINASLDPVMKARMTEYYQVPAFSKMTDEQLMVCYNKARKEASDE